MGPWLEEKVGSRGLFSDERDDTVWDDQNDPVQRGKLKGQQRGDSCETKT